MAKIEFNHTDDGLVVASTLAPDGRTVAIAVKEADFNDASEAAMRMMIEQALICPEPIIGSA